ncbi:hypothetical protein KUTeg_024013 [Tegillarca granosa]|uniref:Transmembrane protein 144 n=1 Tax=Tegillarca granosa TaxID=220873 RepID=A0ABQ9E0P9_TEGGR|nr:hypothetical protein KUTeg_024013 [Tegillarca granosa]
MLTENVTGTTLVMTTENITAATFINASVVTMTTQHMTTELTTEQTTSMIYSSTTEGSNCTQPIPAAWGYISAVIAVVFYGSNFAPVKKFETGDGMFFQWIVCTAILLVGIVVQIIRNAPKFLPLVMIGGVVWETGNICVVPIIKTIGMGIGLCIWGMTNLLSGWATARFGLFGVEKEVPDNPTLNYIGVVLAVFSAVVFSFVKNEITPVTDYTIHDSESEPLLTNRQNRGTSDSLYSTTQDQDPLVFNRRGSSSINNIDTLDETVIDKLSPGWKRFIGLFLSVFSGVLYGQIFTVSTYYQDKDKNLYSQNALDYVFACFCGIYVSSTVYFVIYIIIMKNKPRIYPKVILPGIISGLMWGIATCGWFVANKVLSEPVAFPIVTTVPAIVASIWGVFVFREIKGTRNIAILLLGMTIAVTGAVLAGFSKKPKSGC